MSRIDEYGMKHQQCETGHTGRTQNRVKLFKKGQMGTFDTSGSVYFLGNIIIALQRTMCIRQETTRDKASRQTEYGVHFMLQHHHQD